MRALAVVLAGSLIATGCAANTYRIPTSELMRLSQLPPEARGERVRVVQDIVTSDVGPAPPVTGETQVIIAPEVDIYGSIAPRHRGAVVGPNGKISGPAKDGKAGAAAVLVLAATALVTAAVIEASRFDGWAQLHPMQPVHLIGRDGSYAVMPLAWIDPRAAAWTEEAVVRSNEGPWRPLERAPLSRRGVTYSMYGGVGSLTSADGSLGMGPAWTVQIGGFFTEQVGLVASLFFGWRNNAYDATLFETRSTLELQVLPVQLGILHAGLYGGVGFAQRFEDAINVGGRLYAGDESSVALDGGAMFQLDIATRLALTARLGVSYAHEEQSHDVLFGLSVY